ncbi:MAG: hypothetical protein IRY99_05225 [Isosphaeraceae bacterium]|nr:hypothetical protein [Isosphaeraceae bacterium]
MDRLRITGRMGILSGLLLAVPGLADRAAVAGGLHRRQVVLATPVSVVSPAQAPVQYVTTGAAPVQYVTTTTTGAAPTPYVTSTGSAPAAVQYVATTGAAPAAAPYVASAPATNLFTATAAAPSAPGGVSLPTSVRLELLRDLRKKYADSDDPDLQGKEGNLARLTALKAYAAKQYAAYKLGKEPDEVEDPSASLSDAEKKDIDTLIDFVASGTGDSEAAYPPLTATDLPRAAAAPAVGGYPYQLIPLAAPAPLIPLQPLVTYCPHRVLGGCRKCRGGH